MSHPEPWRKAKPRGTENEAGPRAHSASLPERHSAQPAASLKDADVSLHTLLHTSPFSVAAEPTLITPPSNLLELIVVRQRYNLSIQCIPELRHRHPAGPRSVSDGRIPHIRRDTPTRP